MNGYTPEMVLYLSMEVAFNFASLSAGGEGIRAFTVTV